MTTQWQPIETAPKDGTKICVAWYDDYAKKWRFHVDHWRKFHPIVGGEGFGGITQPTHWMPLPEPPSVESE